MASAVTHEDQSTHVALDAPSGSREVLTEIVLPTFTRGDPIRSEATTWGGRGSDPDHKVAAPIRTRSEILAKGKGREAGLSEESSLTEGDSEGSSRAKGKDKLSVETDHDLEDVPSGSARESLAAESPPAALSLPAAPQNPSSRPPLVHPRPRRPCEQRMSQYSFSHPLDSGDATPTPASRRKGRFARSISQLSMGSFKPLSRSSTPTRPGSPCERDQFTSNEISVAQKTSTTERNKAKAKLGEYFKRHPNKVYDSTTRSTTSLSPQDGVLLPALPSLDRVRSRGRSNSAPGLLSSPRTPLQPVAWNPSVPSLSRETTPVTTPFHSAVSSPLSVYFTFPPEVACPAEDEDKIDTFSTSLPFELQIRVMRALLEICEEEWRREVMAGTWKGARARERWSEGTPRGRRELARIGRVSRHWRKLSLDAQLWIDGPATAEIGADALGIRSVVSLFQESGPAVKRLDLQGFGKSLENEALRRIIAGAMRGSASTNLTMISLRGCQSVPSASITELLEVSPNLAHIDLFALDQICAAHVETIARQCTQLQSLNVSRCRNLPAVALSLLGRDGKNPPPKLKDLRISALTEMSNDILVEVATKHPKLESLDLSFSPRLTDDAFKRIAQERAFSSVRNLNLTGCTSLTSLSLSHFVDHTTAPAGSFLPCLKHLELSRLAPSFDAGEHLSPFLASIKPTLARLDLEDGVNLADPVLGSLNGSTMLECVVLNSCARFTDRAILDIVRSCARLRVLEVDGTGVTDATAKEFVKLVHERRDSRRTALGTAAVEGTTCEDRDCDEGLGPTVLSTLDNRLTGRRLHRELGASLARPRTGYRGHWTGAAVGFYHDGNEPDEVAEAGGAGGSDDGAIGGWKQRLDECDARKIVVRSFYSHLEVDAANAARTARDDAKRDGAKDAKGLLRIRAMSDSVLLANGSRRGQGTGLSRDGSDAGLSIFAGCLVM